MGDEALDLNAMAAEAEAKLRAENPDLLARFVDEHRRQVEGFSWDFRRHGDFLSVFITRNANQPPWERARAEKDFATTVNLGNTTQLRLVRGRPADTQGSFGWTWSEVQVSQEGTVLSWSAGSGYPTRYSRNGRIEVRPVGCPAAVPPCRAFNPESRGSFHGHMMGSEGVSYTTSDFPRMSIDDCVIFDGIDFGITAPFGLGQAVLDSILAEIESAWAKVSPQPPQPAP